MKLTDYIRSDLTWVVDRAESRDGLLRELCERAAGAVDVLDADRLHAALLARETKGSTATPEGVALPHAMVEGPGKSLVAVALVRNGVDFQSRHVASVDLVFVLIGPPDRAWEHLRVLARVARVCHAPGALESLRAASDGADLHRRLVEEDRRHV